MFKVQLLQPSTFLAAESDNDDDILSLDNALFIESIQSEYAVSIYENLKSTRPEPIKTKAAPEKNTMEVDNIDPIPEFNLASTPHLMSLCRRIPERREL